MRRGLACAWTAAVALAWAPAFADPPLERGADPGYGARHILVDQFGYRPLDPKVAVIRTPVLGFDASDGFEPGARYEVRRVSDGALVYSGAPVPWDEGRMQPSSGDKGWWFDFSALREPGRYQVIDAQHGARSATFDIGEDVYRKVLRTALRTFFYQRSAMAKRAPYAQACWTDEAAYLGPGQDGEARDVTDRDNGAKRRDLRGGWFDAGDTNKYVTFAAQPVHQLLDAYQDNPQAFGDDLDIPESGNGIADVLDEVKWETDWLKRMQYPDGSVALKLGELVYVKASPPSRDRTRRYYVPACSSATVSAAGAFAHAAYVFAGEPRLAREAADLAQRAQRAWSRFIEGGEPQTRCDSGVVHAGNADLDEAEQRALAAEAAVYLYAVTGEERYQDYLAQHYREMQPYRDLGWSRYHPDQGKALLRYTQLPNASPSLQATIRGDFLREVAAGHGVFGFAPGDDLYRSFLHDGQYHWGSNGPRANYGEANMDALRFAAAGDAPAAGYLTRALETLHYFHGVNPFGIVYLSNMKTLGATRSVNEIYHAWFAPGSKWSDAASSSCGPAPGFVPGGPNASASALGVPGDLVPPSGQPPQKAYRETNDGSKRVWTFNEPAISIQAAYVKLLSEFVGR